MYSSLRGQLVIWIVFIVVTCTASNSSNCSAIDAFVEITSPYTETILSGQALFPPYTYRIEETNVVTYNTSIDDPCDATGIETDINDKIVLYLEDDNDDCSDHYKVYVAQENGAIAILIANDDGDFETKITDDDSNNVDTNIPARSITQESGYVLAQNISDGVVIKAEFGCLNTDYPLVICVLDDDGKYYWMDGEYQIQASSDYKHGHPVWIRDGYERLLPIQYMFLHDGDGDDEWYWAITEDENMEKDSLINAYCNMDGLSGISEPGLCPIWKTLNGGQGPGKDEYTDNRDFYVNDTLCSISDSYMCITSNREIAGLDGTYRLYNNNVPRWYREWTDCDHHSGWFLFQEYQTTVNGSYDGIHGYFLLVDGTDLWVIASCDIGKDYSDNDKFHPEVCDDFNGWEVLKDGTLDPLDLTTDKSFTISADTTCDDMGYDPNEEHGECVTDPSKKSTHLCLNENSVMHSYLEGDYYATGVVGNTYGTYEYRTTDQLYYDDEQVDIYIWYYGEYSDQYSWWILSPDPMSEAEEKNPKVGVWAFCSADVQDPSDCHGCWNFFWSTYDEGTFHCDSSFEVNSGVCDTNTGEAAENITWPEYVCVGLNTSAPKGVVPSDVDNDFIVGGYEINKTTTQFSGEYPHWTKPKNKVSKQEMHLYYDAFYSMWHIGPILHLYAYLVCMDEKDSANPTDCNEWYDYDDGIGMDHIVLQECSKEDMYSTKSKTEANAAEVAGIVIGVLLAVVLVFGILYWWMRKREQEKKLNGVAAPTTPPDSPTDHRNETGDFIAPVISAGIEMGDATQLTSGDGGGHTTGGMMGGMDMTPLNPDDNMNDTLANDEDDDDDVVPKDDDDNGGNHPNDDDDDDDDDALAVANTNDEEDIDDNKKQEEIAGDGDGDAAQETTEPINLFD